MTFRPDSRLETRASSNPLQRVAVITHFYSPGPAHELVDYLATRIPDVTFFGQPLAIKAEAPSFYRHLTNGKLTTERFGSVLRLPNLIRYAKDALAVVWFVLREPRFDLIIALDPLNVAAVRLARWLKPTPLVYYTIDYIPNRFTNAWLNAFYHWLDRTGVAASAWTWNLSPRMIQGRAERWHSHVLDAKQLTVPMGTHALVAKNQESRIKNQVVFMGHLRKGQGVERLLEATALALKEIPDLKLTIVGGGELFELLKKKMRELELERTVTFTGFVASNDEMRRHLLQADLAVALYEDRPDNFTRYTDPGKPKEYLAAGLPVLISDVPAIAREIEAAGAGIVVDDSAEALAAAMIRLLKDPKKLAVAQSAALQLASTFRWDKIYDQAFESMNDELLMPQTTN